MLVGAVGYNYRHRKDFIMDCPHGVGCPLILLIKEPSVFVINGIEHRAEKNSFILLSPDTPVKYHAAEEFYTDDWLYFNYEQGDNEKFERLDVPKDTLVYLGNIDELSQIMRSVAYEYQLMKEGHEEVTRCYMEIFLLKLARQLKCTDKKSCIITDRNSRFMQLRAYIYAMPEDIADVGSMAWDMGISRSSFQHMYKKMFGVSVMTDVISARMERASQLLATPNLSVREVAERCGYTNEYGFMKRFKMHFGKTPTEFRSML